MTCQNVMEAVVYWRVKAKEIDYCFQAVGLPLESNLLLFEKTQVIISGVLSIPNYLTRLGFYL